jgi:hypothetical protein
MTRRRPTVDECLESIRGLTGGLFIYMMTAHHGAQDIRAAVEKDMELFMSTCNMGETWHPVIIAHMQRVIRGMLDKIDIITQEMDRAITLFPNLGIDPRETAIAIPSIVGRIGKIADDIDKREDQS